MAEGARVKITPNVRDAVIAIAMEAGRAILPYFRQPLDVFLKKDHSPLTQADLSAHSVLVNRLAALPFAIPVLSEESVQIPWLERKSWESYWLVDPLDGTREFIRGSDAFCICIALIHQGTPVFGVIQSPTDQSVWYASVGQGAYRRCVSSTQDLQLHVQAPAPSPLRVALSHTHHKEKKSQGLLARMGEITRIHQGSALKFCAIAEGNLDVYPRLGPTCEWDTAAGQCIVQAAGGQLYSLKTHQPFSYNQKQSLINDSFIVVGDPHLPWSSWLSDK